MLSVSYYSKLLEGLLASSSTRSWGSISLPPLSPLHCIYIYRIRTVSTCARWIRQNRLKIYRVFRFTFAFCLFTCVKHETGQQKYKQQRKKNTQRIEEMERNLRILRRGGCGGSIAILGRWLKSSQLGVGIFVTAAAKTKSLFSCFVYIICPARHTRELKLNWKQIQEYLDSTIYEIYNSVWVSPQSNRQGGCVSISISISVYLDSLAKSGDRLQISKHL